MKRSILISIRLFIVLAAAIVSISAGARTHRSKENYALPAMYIQEVYPGENSMASAYAAIQTAMSTADIGTWAIKKV